MQAAAKKKADNFKKIIKELTENVKFSAQNFWKARKSKAVKKQNCLSIIKENGCQVFGETAIKSAYRDEFVKRLSPNKMDIDMKHLEETTNKLFYLCTNLNTKSNEPDFSINELEDVLSDLQNNKAPGRDNIPAEIFIHIGNDLKNLLLLVINDLKNSHKVPHQWNNVAITTMYKGKGSKKELVNHRGIFLTQVITKIFERLIMIRISENIESISKLQAGARKNKCTADQTFIVRSCINHADT